ncbi:MAG: hypothetical protein AAF206_24455 [Bacteroidota bacterium]
MQSTQQLLRQFSTRESMVNALAEYIPPPFGESIFPDPVRFPLPDEPYVTSWEAYVDYAAESSVFEVLREHLVQFRFPIQAGISQTESYRNACLKGRSTVGMASATGLALEAPDSLHLSIYQSVAGKIPVLQVSEPEDFCRIIQALSFKNEPAKIPSSMGAAMITGINNWDRMHRIQANWKAQYPNGNWLQYFRQKVLPHRALYQDKLIILSEKAYSNVPAERIGLKTAEWLQHSSLIRLEHECTHFFTLRYFGSMANNMYDELLADYMGISKVYGHFRSDWFLQFIGLENYPAYRSGGRMENYLGRPPLSPDAFRLLQEVVYHAAQNITRFEQMLPPVQTLSNRSQRLLTLCRLSLVEIAARNGPDRLMDTFQALATNQSK